MVSIGCRCPASMLPAARRHLLPPLHLPFFLSSCRASSSSTSPRPGRVINLRPLRTPRWATQASMDTAPSTSDGDASFTVTTPLYYVNAAPHMGSAYPTIAADALARFHRMLGHRVRFVTGTDEHGEKIALAAEKRGMSPKAHCDDIVVAYKSLWAALDIKYDSFIRTTDPSHELLVKEVLAKVWERGDIYKAQYAGYYCVDCEEYKDEKELDSEHNCPIHRRPCQHRAEENYFFKLTNYQEQLESFLESNPDFVQPPARRNEVLGWVKEGLRDFSISRANVQWGIPLPQDSKQTVYVWFDALNGYLSGLLQMDETSHQGTEKLAQVPSAGWPASVHIIGKDILRFHAVYWPAMLLSAGLPLPQRVFGHGFLTKDGMKMGKSMGNVLEPEKLVGAYGADAVRYFFMSQIPFGIDGDFVEQRFREVVNARLANDVGNLLNRSLNVLKKNCDGITPYAASDLPASHPVREALSHNAPLIAQAYSKLRFSEALELAGQISGRGNQYVDEVAPWTKLKKGTEQEKEEAKLCLVACLEAVRVVAVLMAPVTPALARRIYAQLALPEERVDQLQWERDTQWGQIPAGHVLSATPAPVFLRLEGDYICDPAPVGEVAATGGGKKKAEGGGKKKEAEAKRDGAAASKAT